MHPNPKIYEFNEIVDDIPELEPGEEYVQFIVPHSDMKIGRRHLTVLPSQLDRETHGEMLDVLFDVLGDPAGYQKKTANIPRLRRAQARGLMKNWFTIRNNWKKMNIMPYDDPLLNTMASTTKGNVQQQEQGLASFKFILAGIMKNPAEEFEPWPSTAQMRHAIGSRFNAIYTNEENLWDKPVGMPLHDWLLECFNRVLLQSTRQQMFSQLWKLSSAIFQWGGGTDRETQKKNRTGPHHVLPRVMPGAVFDFHVERAKLGVPKLNPVALGRWWVPFEWDAWKELHLPQKSTHRSWWRRLFHAIGTAWVSFTHPRRWEIKRRQRYVSDLANLIENNRHFHQPPSSILFRIASAVTRWCSNAFWASIYTFSPQWLYKMLPYDPIYRPDLITVPNYVPHTVRQNYPAVPGVYSMALSEHDVYPTSDVLANHTAPPSMLDMAIDYPTIAQVLDLTIKQLEDPLVNQQASMLEKTWDLYTAENLMHNPENLQFMTAKGFQSFLDRTHAEHRQIQLERIQRAQAQQNSQYESPLHELVAQYRRQHQLEDMQVG